MCFYVCMCVSAAEEKVILKMGQVTGKTRVYRFFVLVLEFL